MLGQIAQIDNRKMLHSFFPVQRQAPSRSTASHGANLLNRVGKKLLLSRPQNDMLPLGSLRTEKDVVVYVTPRRKVIAMYDQR